METILIPVMAMIGLNGGLALILVIAEHFLADYGEYRIRINHEKELVQKGGHSLLHSLKSQGVFLPSACGGRGTCGYCKCKITTGGGSLLPTEEPLLNQQERDNQIRLACQVKLKRDMEIEIPESLFAIRQYQAETVLIRDLTYDIKWVRFQLSPPDTIRFKPGQYIQLESRPYGEIREGVSRAYSICSSNALEDQIELMIRLVPGGICTTWVHQILKTGDRVNLVGPMGDFYLREGSGEIIMVAGGSGMAPMVSILQHIQARKIDRPVSFFFGARTTRDLFFLDEMAEFERAIPSFRFVSALSNPEPDDHWQGETGLITDVLARALKEKNNQSAQGYLCGSPGMVKACTAVLNQYGVSNDRIFFDPFA